MTGGDKIYVRRRAALTVDRIFGVWDSHLRKRGDLRLQRLNYCSDICEWSAAVDAGVNNDNKNDNNNKLYRPKNKRAFKSLRCICVRRYTTESLIV